MSNIEKLMEKLKSAAIKLNCEQWQTRNGFSGVEVIVKGSVEKGHGCVSYQPVASELVDAKTAKAIALFCPANILALLDELEAAEKLIAELEAREVILPQRMDPEGYHIDEAYMVAAEDGEYLDRDEVIEAMRTAGIRINGEG
ncbi:ead/Ea22-like family protein [Enterobacter cloacae complex sp. 409J2]|uniref:ead/Ea22-like family protein n=1 Tax=unclassified Enterobacter cloacae complex TaxID=2757714 RepID=UPI003CF68553